MKNLQWMIAAGTVLGMAAGGAAGYLVAKKQLEQKYDEIAKHEIEEAKQFYSVLYKKGDFKTVEGAAKKLLGTDEKPAAAAMIAYNKAFVPGGMVEPATVKDISRNVFKNAKTTEGTRADFEQEVLNRTEEAPYVISYEEYMENENGYTQLSMTYYAGDGVLADERDDQIEDLDDMVGENNLGRFGAWSNDAAMVYVRNHIRQLEFEIARTEGKYSVEVAGLSED
jgi:hypothetical protein